MMALDGFLADSALESRSEAGYGTWVKWSPAARLPSLLNQPVLFDPPLNSTTSPALVFKDTARQALDELAMISFGRSSKNDGLVHLSQLPIFVSAAAILLETQAIDSFARAAEMHDGANPLRIVITFLSALNPRDREVFRLLAGMDLDVVFRLLDFSGIQGQPRDAPVSNKAGYVPAFTANKVSKPENLLNAEQLLASWRSSRLRSVKLQQGSLSHSAARSEAGKHLAALLATDYGLLIFQPGWAGERFAQEAQQDLNEAWSAIGRAVATDLRRAVAPWLARKLGTSTIPSFSLEYSVQPSPANAYQGLMTMRAIVSGGSHSIPYQVVARALASASTEYFDDAPVPIRYVEEPLPGLRIYISRDVADSSKAITDLAADLSAAYPAVLFVPSPLLRLSIHTEASFEEVCIALDGMYREVAIGVMLARSFTSLLQSHAFPELASLILQVTPEGMEYNSGMNGTEELTAGDEQGGAD